MTTNTFTMNTREIAELTGKQHFNVMRDTRNMLKELELDAITFEGIYLDAYNREKPMLVIPEDLVNTLITGYSIKQRHSVVKALQEIRDNATTIEEAKGIAWNALAACREDLRKNHTEVTSVIKESKLSDTHGNTHFFNFIAKLTLGAQPSVLRKELNIPKNQALRDFLVESNDTRLFAYDRAVAEGTTLLRLGFSYDQMKAHMLSH